MTEKERLIAILKTLSNLEIKGLENISIMYSVIGFIKQEISAIEKEEEAKKIKEKGG